MSDEKKQNNDPSPNTDSEEPRKSRLKSRLLIIPSLAVFGLLCQLALFIYIFQYTFKDAIRTPSITDGAVVFSILFISFAVSAGLVTFFVRHPNIRSLLRQFSRLTINTTLNTATWLATAFIENSALNPTFYDRRQRHFEAQLEKISERLDGSAEQSHTISPEEVQRIAVEQLLPKLSTEVANSLAERYAKEEFLKRSTERIHRVLEEVLSGLERELKSVTFRSGRNLIFGVIGTGCALGFTWLSSASALLTTLQNISVSLEGSSATTSILTAENANDMVFYSLLAKTGAVAIWQTFALFFLALFVRGLWEIRYFRNEITTVMSWKIAITAAQASGDERTMQAITLMIASVDRNRTMRRRGKGGGSDTDDSPSLHPIAAAFFGAKDTAKDVAERATAQSAKSGALT